MNHRNEGNLDHNRFVNLMTTISMIFNDSINESILDIYYNLFKKYDYEQFEKAIYKVVLTKKFHKIPLPAEINEFIRPEIEKYFKKD